MTLSQTNADQMRPPGDEPGAIVRIGQARRSEAIGRLVSAGSTADGAAAERFLSYAKTNAIRLDGLWSRLDADGSISETVLAVPSPGRTAMVFASRPRNQERIASVAELIDHAASRLGELEVDLAQALLEPGQKLERESFTGAQFADLARLSYLERPLSRSTLPAKPQWPAGVTVEPYHAGLYDDLATALEQSYIDTRDCPGLYGLRRTKDIIAGHQATGTLIESLWTLLRLDGEPAGALLLNPFPAHKTVELVYLGLAPIARGSGLGRQLLRHGLWRLRERRERTLTLAVDECNAPALALYESEGLRAVLQRVALIRPLRAAAGAG